MALSEKDFQVLDALDRFEITTQRQLAAHAGISLGQVNYVLKSLLDKGLVKLGNFRKSSNKISYAYLLTPKGIEKKSKLAVKFVLARLNEYENLRQILAEKLTDIEAQGISRVIVVAPDIVQEFLISIIKEKHPYIEVVGRCANWEELKQWKAVPFDVALLFDTSEEGIRTISNATGIPGNKLALLW